MRSEEERENYFREYEYEKQRARKITEERQQKANQDQHTKLVSFIKGLISVGPETGHKPGKKPMNPLIKCAEKILQAIGNESSMLVYNTEIQDSTGLEPNQINQSIKILEEESYLKVTKQPGVHPFEFKRVELTTKGKQRHACCRRNEHK